MGSTVHPNLPTVPRLKVVTQIPPCTVSKCYSHFVSHTVTRERKPESSKLKPQHLVDGSRAGGTTR